MKTVSTLVRFFLISLITFSCSTPREEYIPIIAVSLNQSEAELNEGSSLQLHVQIVPSNVSDKTTMWGSSKPDVAKVSESGLVTALSAGKSTITATAGDKNATCTVTVIKPTIEVQSVTLDKDDITIVKGQTAVLKASINPADATEATVTWTTSDEVVAKVDQNGRVSAMGGGSAVITAAAGNKSADCSVTVTVLVESISLDRNEVTLVEDESISLTATVLPDDATDKSVEWMSSNSGIATIDSEGNITAVKEGSATITAKSGDKTASCTVTVSKKIIHVESISIDRPLLNIAVGATETLTATVLPNDATDKSFTWASTNTTISEVDQTGRVTAKAAGTVTITATTVDGGLIAACEVTVYVPYVPVENITLSNTSLNLNKGQTATLTAIISPTNATVQTVSWSSNNMDVAQIDRYGKVTAVGGGQATILAEAGNISAECVVTVSVPVESIELDHSQMTIVEGETVTLQALVLPDDATDKTIAWTSSNTGVAIVDAEGNVTGQSEGSATITAKSGAANAVCTVIVSKKIIPVSSIEISKETLSLLVGETAHITATVYPENATDKSFIWTSSNTTIADVDQSGKVTAKAAGMVTITATTTDGGKIAACEVTVSVPYIEVTSITLDIDEVALEKGQTVTLIATVKPDNASVKTVTWSSSDTGVATVDKDGKVIAVVGGTAIITAKAGNCTATCTVIVTVPVTEVTLNKTELALIEGASETLYATITPADATYTGITWTSSDPNVATVDGDGKVTAHTEGSTIITAKAGDKSATCDVSVAFGAANYLTLSSAGQSSISLTIHGSCSPVLYYSTDATNWSRWDYSPLSFSSSSDLYLCGYNPVGLSNSSSNFCTFESSGDLFEISGNIMSLIDKNKTVDVIPCDYCFSRLFHNNTKLQSSPDLPASTLRNCCYSDMFSGCTSLTKAPSLPALELAYCCYYGMFWNCTSIEETPNLPATKLAVYCYAHMFQKCTNLRSIHSLPASSLADYCYHEMFRECTSLILPPSLPATILGRYCYWDMFRDCSSLTVAPALPATTLADYCYFGMFSGCDNLSSASELPATTLKEGCYSWMYSKTAISSAPILKATNLTKNCYDAMFNCCSNLSFVQCLAQDISADGCISVWLDGVAASGVFYRSPSMASWEIGPSGIPSGWTIKRYGIDSDIIPVDAITLDKTSLELTVGQSVSLNATVSPTNATEKTISWSSSNQSAATVSNGIVSAKSVGTTIITAMAGDKTATCSVAVSSNVINVSSITLNKESLTLTVDESDVLIATIKPDDATDKSIIWASTNSAIASVDQTGKITAKSSGTVTISASTNDGGKVAVCEVSVVNPTIPVTDITLDRTVLNLTEGQSKTLYAAVSPENATNKNITWTSSDTSVATVSSSGLVSAIAVGTATITATTNDGAKKATCIITVDAATVDNTSISLNQSTLTLFVGDTYTLIATVTNPNASYTGVIWKATRPSVATVSSNGLITAISVGTTMIVVTTNDGSKIATCMVSVKPVAVTSVSLDKSSLDLFVGDTYTLNATVSPSNAANKDVTWKSSNTSVATVSSSGLITAIAIGTAWITVTTDDGSKKASCELTVNPIEVTSILLNKNTLNLLVGGTYTLIATVNPNNATNKEVVWSSSNPSVATISSSGNLTALEAGTTTITVTTNDGSKTSTCSVTVSEPEWMDLGLPSGLKWATCNVGASSPEEFGEYYAWGETRPKNNYSWDTYLFWDDYHNKLDKYYLSTTYGVYPPDYKMTLALGDDVARIIWQGSWRMPTKSEFEELLNNENCTNKKTTLNGVKGIKITSKINGNSIFLPCAGYRDGSTLNGAGFNFRYWSSSLNEGNNNSAYYLYYGGGEESLVYPYIFNMGNLNRCCGFSVRPITD